MFVLLAILSIFSVWVKCSISPSESSATAMPLQALDFEVFGRVQGVFFRKYTKQQAEKLGLRGWCLNTSKGTVLGHVQGPSDKVESMMHWLKNTGSPSSKVDKAEFRNQQTINQYSIEGFVVRNDQ